MGRKSNLQKAREAAEISRLNLEAHKNTSRLERLERVKTFFGKYDATDSDFKRQRRQSGTERKTEDNMQSRRERLKGAALGRDLQRNTATFKTLMKQFDTCVVGGDGPKIQLDTGSEDFDKAAANWFNSDWAKWCDGVDDTPLAELVGMTETAVKREGDCLWVFDDFDRDDGTVRVFESDQLVTVRETDWEQAAQTKHLGDWPWKERDPKDRRKYVAMKQEHGIVRDRRGRVVAYIVSSEHGKGICDLDEVTIVPRYDERNNPKGSGKLVKRPWRFNQYRGVGDALTIANIQRDIYEMISAELQSAKAAAQNAAWVEVDPESEGGLERALLAAGLDPDLILYGAEENDSDDNITPVLSKQYEELEGMTGGKTIYANPGEKIHIHDHDRPASSVEKFGDWIQGSSGAALGVARSRASLKADTSYTAFRGEELMSWLTFYADQKSLERRLMDWLSYKAISWAIRKKEIVISAPAAWHKMVSWRWPKMREVDEEKTKRANSMALKNAEIDYSDLLGPNWEQKFHRLAKMVELARELDLPLSIFETVAGAELDDESDAGAAENKDGSQDS